ncbi:hypothetical protein DAPPUDRAFT_97325 [Daphnia pulex]|uniref:Uncharacterized protein n=1 Tax=Daphnia pulex TaxID=6669 RepID=E9FZL9_DAPPU|nr:hypothetical protein DAPPUDRAFT_97325 [Daphnia pulex]|eukprot:EFX87244.1 hypothetical protein DAPPUDRAFT_97325 [Daphnia pulex]
MLSFLFLLVCWVMVTLSAGIARAEFALPPPLYPATLIHSGRGAVDAGSSDYSTRHLYYSQLLPYYFSGNRRRLAAAAASAGSMAANHYGYHQQAGSNYYEVDYPSYYSVHPSAPIPPIYYQQQDPVSSQYRGNMMMGSAGQAEGPMLRERQNGPFQLFSALRGPPAKLYFDRSTRIFPGPDGMPGPDGQPGPDGTPGTPGK